MLVAHFNVLCILLSAHKSSSLYQSSGLREIVSDRACQPLEIFSPSHCIIPDVVSNAPNHPFTTVSAIFPTIPDNLSSGSVEVFSLNAFIFFACVSISASQNSFQCVFNVSTALFVIFHIVSTASPAY